MRRQVSHSWLERRTLGPKFSSLALHALVGCLLLALGACSMPTSGPRGDAIEWRAVTRVHSPERLPYCLVSVTPRVADIVARSQYRLAGQFSDRRGPTGIQIGVGDV